MMMNIKIPNDKKEELVAQIQQFFVEEDLDEIGRFQAERLIEEMIKLVGPFAYNQAIGDARKLVTEKLSNIEEDLYVLEKNEGNKKSHWALFYFSFLCSLYSCTFSFTLPTVSLAVPFTLSHFPSACNFLLSVTFPTTSFTSPFTLSIAPSTFSFKP